VYYRRRAARLRFTGWITCVSPTERPTDIVIAPDARALAEAAAGELLRLANAAIAARGRFLVALSGGSTPRAMHARLASADLRTQLDWSNVDFFWSDERAVGPDDPQSNYRMARETLLGPLRIDAARVHRMRGEAGDLDAAAREYEQTLRQVTGAARDAAPVLDLVLLGMGGDGHTASLFPGTAALDVEERLVVANDVPQLSTRRLTFTFDLILAARAVRILVAGAEKAAVFASVRQGDGRDGQRYPVQRLLGAPPVRWLVDRAAASRIDGGLVSG
jgi:6-phosphogluconolactonase